MAYENVVTVTGGAGTTTRQIPIDKSVSSTLLVGIISMANPATLVLSTIIPPSGYSMSLVAGMAQLVVPNNMTKGRYSVQIPDGAGKYVQASFTIETFPNNGVRED